MREQSWRRAPFGWLNKQGSLHQCRSCIPPVKRRMLFLTAPACGEGSCCGSVVNVGSEVCLSLDQSSGKPMAGSSLSSLSPSLLPLLSSSVALSENFLHFFTLLPYTPPPVTQEESLCMDEKTQRLKYSQLVSHRTDNCSQGGSPGLWSLHAQ